jgi:hypothetical protein
MWRDFTRQWQTQAGLLFLLASQAYIAVLPWLPHIDLFTIPSLDGSYQREMPMKVGVYNEDGEPIGFDYVYEPDPNDMVDEWYDRDVYYDEEDE